MEQNLANFIRYCLSYIKLTRQRTVAAQQKFSVELPKGYFGLIGLLNGDIDGNAGELINLETFYSLDPKKVTIENQEIYNREKALANKIEEIYNKYRNDQFTKQIVFNFGCFEIEIPIEIDEDELDVEGEENKKEKYLPRTRIDRYPLFTLPVRIEKEEGKYVVYPVDTEVQVNIEMLESILGEDLYYQLVEEIGKYEIEGLLSLPFTEADIFINVWHKIKERLRHTDAKFDEDSFTLEEMHIALSPRANYFLAEDLRKLSELTEEEFQDTALISWTRDDELTIETDILHEKDLYFPFLYDKYQLRVMSISNNRAAIVEGPPGTGKSETIANLLCHMAATGKKTLFVSQKAQALKVVKDKLKKLNVKYLFGYIPNPRSTQLGEEDELDSVATQLSALDSHIEKMGYKLHPRGRTLKNKDTEDLNPEPSLVSVVNERLQLKESFITAIETERKIWQLHQELKNLSDYDISVSDITCFERSFPLPQWQEIKTLKADIEKLSNVIHEYREAEHGKKFDKLFSNLDLHGTKYSEAVGKIKYDVERSGYDRHSRIMRKINNTLRKLRLSKYRFQLPREILDYIDKLIDEDISRNEAKKSLENLYNCCRHYENIKELKDLKKHLQDSLYTCGTSDDEFQTLDNLVTSSQLNEIEEIKNKILRVYEIKKELEKLKTRNVNELSTTLKEVEKSRSERIALYIQNITDKNIVEKWKQSITVRQIIKKLAKAFGKSKRAFKTFDSLRKDPDNFNAILDLIPVWIMELDDASRIIPLEAGIFDYVILDEASQCNVAYTLPAMFRAKRALFFGDSEQMRDNTIIFKSNKSFDELAHRYHIPEELQIKATGSGVQSVLDIASLRGLFPVPLRYHYRSPNELIGFGNRYFYRPKGKELIPLNSNYLTYKNTDRIMILHHVDSDWSEEISDKVNVAEARAIFELFKELRSDDRYRDKSVGILSFFDAQATYIRDLFEKEGYKEEEDNYKVSIIEGIQGDEKDIIIYSFVIRTPDQKNKYVPLTGEGGDIQADINKGRVNVAFSRARLQVHCFVSMPIHEFPEKIWIKKYLKYVEENGKVDFYSTDLKPFDSYFEEEFYNLARSGLKRGYTIQNQVESCGFKIDFVMSETRNGKKIAVECDGPTHFSDELDEEYGIYVEDDEERQRVLEAAGWTFYRIKYSDWIDQKFDRNSVVNDIIGILS